jgi:hypothetical protein
MHLEFSGPVWYWRGPSPFHFITVTEPECEMLRAEAPGVSYGWGMIPVEAQIGTTRWRTSLYPKDGGYVLPVKDAVRKAEGLDRGSSPQVRLDVARA